MAVNCRVEMRFDSRYSERENFERLLHVFRKKMTDIGVITLWRKKQYYETKGEKRRRKKKESILRSKQEQRSRQQGLLL